jgi:hypothetical protein
MNQNIENYLTIPSYEDSETINENHTYPFQASNYINSGLNSKSTEENGYLNSLNTDGGF